jgi:hypothetical protein
MQPQRRGGRESAAEKTVSKKHLHRYCDEFSFRWNGRKLQGAARRDAAVKGAEGKWLMYKTPAAEAGSENAV